MAAPPLAARSSPAGSPRSPSSSPAASPTAISPNASYSPSAPSKPTSTASSASSTSTPAPSSPITSAPASRKYVPAYVILRISPTPSSPRFTTPAPTGIETKLEAINMYDAIIVGARCAGSPTAMLLARKGYKVLVVDKATFPSDTMSTHLIHQPSIARLARWGLLEELQASNCPPITHIKVDVGPFALEG